MTGWNRRSSALSFSMVFGKGGGADHLDLTPGQSRLEDVGGVHGAFRVPRPGDGVDLVDEQNDVAVGLHLADETLYPAFKLAPELGAGHQAGEVQQPDLFIPQTRRHLALHNALGNALGDGGFAYARLTDKTGVVFLAAGEDLNGAGDLPVPADDPVQPARLGFGGEVFAVAVQEFALLFPGTVVFLAVGLFFSGFQAKGEGG